MFRFLSVFFLLSCSHVQTLPSAQAHHGPPHEEIDEFDLPPLRAPLTDPVVGAVQVSRHPQIPAWMAGVAAGLLTACTALLLMKFHALTGATAAAAAASRAGES